MSSPSQTLSAQTPTENNRSEVSQFISFALTPKIQGMLPTNQLGETLNLELANIIQIPDLPPAVIGVCGWRGEILWLIDLAYFFGFQPLLTTEYHQPKCSILRVTSHSGTVGFLVSQVKQLIRCEQTQIKSESTSIISSELSHCIRGTFINSQRETLLIVDVEKVIQSLV